MMSYAILFFYLIQLREMGCLLLVFLGSNFGILSFLLPCDVLSGMQLLYIFQMVLGQRVMEGEMGCSFKNEGVDE